MICLFAIDKKGKILLRPESTKLCAEFAYLSEKDILCIILAFDHYSIYRQFPEDERKRRARAHVFGSDQEFFFDAAKIKKAVHAYKSLQYDHRRNQIITYKRKLDMINLVMETSDADDLKLLKDIITSSKELRKAISEIEQEINQEEEEEMMDEGNMKLSFLERAQANRKNYLEIIAKRETIKSNKENKEEPKSIIKTKKK